MLWRCLEGSRALEPDFRCRNKQHEQSEQSGETKLPFSWKCLWWFGEGREGSRGALAMEMLHCFPVISMFSKAFHESSAAF